MSSWIPRPDKDEWFFLFCGFFLPIACTVVLWNAPGPSFWVSAAAIFFGFIGGCCLMLGILGPMLRTAYEGWQGALEGWKTAEEALEE